MKITKIEASMKKKAEQYHKPKKEIAFKATPKQILAAVETANICPGKRKFLSNIAGFFTEAENQLAKIVDAPENFIFKLGQKNKIPKSMEQIKLEEMDEFLNNDGFKCSPTSTCSCGEGFSKGGFMAKLLEMIGIENPGEILISKK